MTTTSAALLFLSSRSRQEDEPKQKLHRNIIDLDEGGIKSLTHSSFLLHYVFSS